MFRKILIAVLLFGAAGAAVGAGTFASFSASTTNATSTFATGTLTLSNTKNNGTACLSSAGGGGISTNTNNCEVLFTGLTGLRPGSSPVTVNLTVAPGGTLSANTFKYGAACTDGDAAGTSVHGNGEPCDAVETYIQEYNGPFFDGNGDPLSPTALTSCLFPAGASACATNFSGTNDALSNLPTTGAPATIANGLSAARYFKIGVQMPSTAGNEMQGRKADFSFTWSID